ncbi:MAG: zinc-finger domain-containing protein [Pseudomonadota bacterium]
MKIDPAGDIHPEEFLPSVYSIMTDTIETKSTTQPPEVIYVAKRRISCNGGGGALGHPLVWYSLDDDEAVCGYCGRHFIFDPEKAQSA